MPSREPSLSASATSTSEQVQLLEHLNNQAVFYPGRQHGKHLDLLVHLSRYSNLLLTVTGPTGSGKTHLKNKLKDQIDSGVTAVSLDAQKVSQAPQLLAALESALRLDIPPQADTRLYLEEIRNHTQNLSEDGGSCLLLIDNAEALDQAALDLLLELATTSNDSRRPHIALFGREDLAKRLNDRANQPRFEAVGHHLPLEAFSEAEARGYLEHRCNSVGLALPLNDQQFQRVYKASRGWPGLLNTALIEELEMLASTEAPVMKEAEPTPPKKTTKKPSKKIQLDQSTLIYAAIGVLVLVVLVIAFLYAGNSKDSTISPTATGLISRSQEIRQDTWEAAAPATQGREALEQVEQEVRQRAPLEETLPEPEAVDTLDAPPPEPDPEPTPRTDGLDDAPPAISELDTPIEPPSTVVEEAPRSRFQDEGNRREAWLMDRNPQNFTLQMLASSEESTITGFIAEQSNPEQFNYYRRDHANSPWVLVYGDYSSRAAAEAARDNLPSSLRNQQPWLRSFQGIQNDLESR